MKSSRSRSFLATALLYGLAGGWPPAFSAETGEPVAVPNPSFEEGESLPLGWRAMKGNRPRPSLASIFAWDKEFAHSGKRSLYIRKEGGGPVRWTSTEPVAVSPGVAYELAVWYRGTPAKGAAIRVTLASPDKGKDGKPWATGRQIDLPSSPPEWRRFAFVFTPPPGVEKLLISLVHAGSGRAENASELWFDDITLREIVPSPEKKPLPPGE